MWSIGLSQLFQCVLSSMILGRSLNHFEPLVFLLGHVTWAEHKRVQVFSHSKILRSQMCIWRSETFIHWYVFKVLIYSVEEWALQMKPTRRDLALSALLFHAHTSLSTLRHWSSHPASRSVCLSPTPTYTQDMYPNQRQSEKHIVKEGSSRTTPSPNSFQLQNRGHSFQQGSLENSCGWTQASDEMIWVDLREVPSRSWFREMKSLLLWRRARNISDLAQQRDLFHPSRSWTINICQLQAQSIPLAEIKRAPILAGTRSSAQGRKSKPWLAVGTTLGGGEGERWGGALSRSFNLGWPAVALPVFVKLSTLCFGVAVFFFFSY